MLWPSPAETAAGGCTPGKVHPERAAQRERQQLGRRATAAAGRRSKRSAGPAIRTGPLYGGSRGGRESWGRGGPSRQRGRRHATRGAAGRDPQRRATTRCNRPPPRPSTLCQRRATLRRYRRTPVGARRSVCGGAAWRASPQPQPSAARPPARVRWVPELSRWCAGGGDAAAVRQLRRAVPARPDECCSPATRRPSPGLWRRVRRPRCAAPSPTHAGALAPTWPADDAPCPSPPSAELYLE